MCFGGAMISFMANGINFLLSSKYTKTLLIPLFFYFP